jgi:hypothetical protein
MITDKTLYLIFGAMMLLALAWVALKVVRYVQAERARERANEMILSDDQFKAYLENLKNQNVNEDEPSSSDDPDSTRES